MLPAGSLRVEVMAQIICIYPLVILHSHGIDGPFIDGLPIQNGDIPWQCKITRWYI